MLEQQMAPGSMLKVIQSHPIWLVPTQSWMFNQVKYLPAAVENHVVCEATENLDQFGLSHIHCLGAQGWIGSVRSSGIKGTMRVAQLLWLWRNCRRIRPHIVHSHFGNIGYFNSWILRWLRVKHVVTFYGLDVNKLPVQDPRWKARYRALFRSADLFLCEGPHMARCLVELGCRESKTRVQHLGVEVDKIQFRPRQWSPGSPLRVLIAASFREKKGIPFAIEALGRVQHEFPLEVTVIGDETAEPVSKAEKRKILATIDRYNLANKVRLLGFQSYSIFLEEALQHHVFLSPSVTASDGDTEGGAPVSLLDMAASGMVLISTRHCDIPEIIQHQHSGLLAEERDVNGLVNALRWVVTNSEVWHAMLLAGRKRVEERFNVRQQGSELHERYAEVLI